jgi:hypothetical protein
MVFVDALGRDIHGEAQEGDLQLEADRAKHPAKPAMPAKPPARPGTKRPVRPRPKPAAGR